MRLKEIVKETAVLGAALAFNDTEYNIEYSCIQMENTILGMKEEIEQEKKFMQQNQQDKDQQKDEIEICIDEKNEINEISEEQINYIPFFIKLPYKTKIKMVYDIARGMTFLHQNKMFQLNVVYYPYEVQHKYNFHNKIL